MSGFTGHHHTEESKRRIAEKLKGRKGNKGSFQKGHKTWNKGKKMSEETKAKLQSTMFQKGNKTWNYLPIYSERITKDDYIEIKVSDIPNVSRCVNWRPKHLWIYEQYHKCKVDTSKDCVIFLDGDKRNFDIDNLMLISRKLNRVINSHSEYSIVKGNAELSKINIARAKLQITRLDIGEKFGLVSKAPNNVRYFKSDRNIENIKRSNNGNNKHQ